MKVLLDIQDGEAKHVMKMLEGLPYVRTKQLTEEKALLLEELREAAEEMKMVQQGVKQVRDAQAFINEL